MYPRRCLEPVTRGAPTKTHFGDEQMNPSRTDIRARKRPADCMPSLGAAQAHLSSPLSEKSLVRAQKKTKARAAALRTEAFAIRNRAPSLVAYMLK